MQDIKGISHEFEKFNDMFFKLKGDYRFSRLGKPFETENSKYFLDSGTGKVFQVSNNLYNVLECLWNTDKFEALFELELSSEELLDSLNELEEVVKNENILQMPPITTMYCNNGEKRNQNISDTQMKHLAIEMTERCNLRCKYCIYNEGECGFRTFGKKDITFDTVKKAIDLMALSTEEEVYISFYGGEPLLKFDLIKQSIEYCNEKLSNKKIAYNMTTNATLITEEIANYLAGLENYYTTISLDGPELIHNKNRVFADGTGSFEKTIEGLRNLVKAEGENASERIHFNIVLDDTSKDTFEEIQNFFTSSDYIPKNPHITTSYIESAPRDFEYLGVGTEEDRELNEYIKNKVDPLTDWNIEKIENKLSSVDKSNLVSKEFIDKGLDSVHRRMLIDKPSNEYYMNGCCVPGGRRLYLTVNGDFAVCERIGPSPFIGNVDEGINFENVKKYYIDDFVNEVIKYCNDCWAVHMCKLCYTNCYNEEGVHIPYRHLQCIMQRNSIYKDLVLYHELLEKDPQSLSYLNDIKYS
ncbi:radical SAM protein [Paraclostridium sordellii]